MKSYDIHPWTTGSANQNNTNTLQKSSIAQRIQTVLWRLVEAKSVMLPVVGLFG